MNNIINGIGELFPVVKDLISWGKNNWDKYAKWILVIILVSVITKGFGVKIKV